MPIHDWKRVRSNRFHDFHQTWTVAIAHALNSGALPSGYFAMLERKTIVPEPDVIALERTAPADLAPCYAATDLRLPEARFVMRANSANYARRANRVTVRHPDGDVAAVIEIVSPGNKESRHALSDFTRKAVRFLQAGVNLLIVDLFPPSKRDPQGVHKAIWDRLADEPFTLPLDKPLTLAVYAVGNEMVAYIEPVAVGDLLPDMPIFLTAEQWVPCPLESAYQTAWEQFPAPLKGPLESPTLQ